MKRVDCAMRSAAASIKKKGAASLKEKPMKGTKASNKAEKDPNEPKKPQGAFFLFMSSFRPTCSAKGPAACKAGGEKWKSMSDTEKKPFVDEAATIKAEYSRALAAYKSKKVPKSNADDEGEMEDS